MLSHIKIPRYTVDAGVGTFDLRGITFADLSHIVANHRADLAQAAGIVAEAGEDMAVIAEAIATRLPRLAAAAIACAADEPGAEDTAAQLPLPVQLEALVVIGRLTFADEGAVPKFLSNLQMLMGGLQKAKSAVN